AAEKKPRLVVYNGEMRVVVKEFDPARETLIRLVQDNGGYIVNSELAASTRQNRAGVWRVKIPVAKFDDFKKELAKLGQVEKDKVDTEDISDRYYDQEVVVKNLKAKEDRFRELYQKVAKTLDEIEKVDGMIAR